MKRLIHGTQWRDARLLAVVAAILLVAAGVAGAWLGREDIRRQKLEQAEAHARVLAASVSGALAFSDSVEAEEAVAALYASPTIEAVGVYDIGGAAVVRRDEGVDEAPEQLLAVSKPGFVGGRATATAPVKQGDSVLGRVYVALVPEAGAAQWMRYLGPALLLAMAGVLIAAIIAGQQELTARADELSHANESLLSEIAQRKKAQHALAQAQKMEAIGQLTGGLSHDFNNLLAAVSAGLKLLERQEDPARRAKIQASLEDAIQRGARLTRQLLSFARGRSAGAVVIEPCQRIERMRELLQRSLSEETAFEISGADDAWRVLVDPDQLELVVLSLVVNARDAMPRGGKLRIAFENASRMDEGLGDFVRISVSDTGAGMSVETLDRAFEPFFTTKDVGKGAGLGLSQAYAFAKQSGGIARIESVLGEGTTVYLDLPRTLRPASPQSAAYESPTVTSAGALAPPSGKGKRILVVEDDAAVGQMVCALVEDHGYDCARASNAAEALAKLEEGAFDIVFSDIVMPGGMDGVELARIIRQRWPAAPILLTTGYSGKARLEPAEFEVIYKPWQPRELLERIGAVVASRVGPTEAGPGVASAAGAPAEQA